MKAFFIFSVFLFIVNLSEAQSDESYQERQEKIRQIGIKQWNPWWQAEVVSQKLKEEVPPEYKKAGCVLFSANWMSRITPTTLPTKDQIGKEVKVRMALNEYESACFGVFALTDLEKIEIKTSVLKNEQGETAQGLWIEPRVVEYGTHKSFKKTRLWPMRLWPAFPINLKQGTSHEFWFTFRANEKETKPGKYKGVIKVVHSKGTAEIPLVVEILNITLLSPNESFRLGYFGSLIENKNILVDLFRYNVNMHSLWMSGSLKPWPKMKIEGGELKLDFSKENQTLGWLRLDKAMRLAKEVGWCGPMFLFLGPPTNAIKEKGIRKLYLERKVAPLVKEEYNPSGLTGKIRAAYIATIKQITDYARRNNWPTIAWTPWDEPVKYVWAGEGLKNKFYASCQAIQEAGALSFAEIHRLQPWGRGGRRDCGYVFTPVLDYFCSNALGADEKCVEKIRKLNPKCKIFVYMRAEWYRSTDMCRFQPGFYTFGYEGEGFYGWAFREGMDPQAHTPAFTLREGIIPSPALIAAREGADDRRYLETYIKLAREKGIEPEKFLQPIREAGRKLRGKGGRETVLEFYAACKKAEELDALREKVIEEILRLKGEY